MASTPYTEGARAVARALADTRRSIEAEDAVLKAVPGIDTSDMLFADLPRREALCQRMAQREEAIRAEAESLEREPPDPRAAQIVARFTASANARPSRIVLWWLGVLVALYAALALPLSDAAVSPRNPAGAVDRAGMSAALFDLRAYAARVAGTLPQACFPSTDAPALETSRQSDWRKPGIPVLLRLVGVGPGTSACEWWQGWNPVHHVLAAVSLDVGLFQKLSLLVFLIGWRSVSLRGLDIALTRATMAARGAINPLLPGTPAHLFPARAMVALGAQSSDVQLTGMSGDRQRIERLTDGYRIYADQLGALCRGLSETALAGALAVALVRHVQQIVREGLDFGDRAALIDQARKSEAQLRESAGASPWATGYILWLLPTLGFLGTIYGISMALIAAAPVLAKSGGDFQPVVEALGVAFDTTAFALFLLAMLTLRDMRNEARARSTIEQAIDRVRDRVLNQLEPASARADTGLLRDGLRALADLRAAAEARRPQAPVRQEGPDGADPDA